MSELARNSDPIESHDAAAFAESSGLVAADSAFALEAATKFPGKTARELEELTGCEPGRIWKRMSGLVESGEVRKGESRVSTHSQPSRRNPRHCKSATYYVVDAAVTA